MFVWAGASILVHRTLVCLTRCQCSSILCSILSQLVARTGAFSDAVADLGARRLGRLEGVSVSTGLVANHAYAVLDCVRIENYRPLDIML